MLAAAPRRPGIHFRIGRVLLERAGKDGVGRRSDSRLAGRSRRSSTLDPTNANAAYELAEMHRKAGELEPARKLFEQALTHYPAFDQALVGLARTLIALGRPAEALPHLQAALKENPENEVAWYQLAQAYRAAREHGRAGEGARRVQQGAQPGARRTAALSEPKRDVTPQALDVKPPK